jgi:hypothetical protein
MYIKNFSNFLNESGLEWLKTLSEIDNIKQSEYFKWQYDNAKIVNISKPPTDIIKGKHMIKECFRNAYDIVQDNYSKDVKYVEGIILFQNIPIEHAWNKLGDIYFDVTSEIKGYKYEEYISIVEIDASELMNYAEQTGKYGPYLELIYKNSK